MDKFGKIICSLLSILNIDAKLNANLKSQIDKANSTIFISHDKNDVEDLTNKEKILSLLGLPPITYLANHPNKPTLNKSELNDILNSSKKYDELVNILNEEPANLKISIEKDERLYIVGDIHGSMRSILELNKTFRKDLKNGKGKALFLGDIVDDKSEYKDDRMGIFPFLHICNLKLQYPDRVFILCGNHEASYGLGDQNNRFHKIDYTETQKEKLCKILSNLPVCATITCGNNKYFAVHGCPYENTDLNSLSKIHIDTDSHFQWPNEADSYISSLNMLWNDYKDNSHGAGGSTKNNMDKFMQKNNFQCIFKAHQHTRPTLEKDEKVYTIISFKNKNINPRYAVLENEQVEIKSINI